jgi:glycosyltransferase EpsE
MSNPRVSILMLTYNSVQFVKAAVDSVKQQTYKDWELIISDDGSRDGTWELAQALAESDSRIKCHQNPKRLGIPGNRAAAFAVSTGDLICHLDGDDELYPYSVATMVEVADAHPDVALFQSDNAWMNGDGVVYQYHANKEPEENLSHFGWRHFGMYRRSAYDTTAGYNTKLISACEDGDLFMQIAEKYPFMRVPYVLYKHRWHGGNASGTNKKCDTCTERPICNYIRVWAKHAGMDHITYQPLNKE